MRKVSPQQRAKGKQLRKFREGFGFTCAELAEILGVNERTLRAWAHGEPKIPRHVIFLFSFFDLKRGSGDG